MRVEVKVLSNLIPATGGPLEVEDGATGLDLLRVMGVERTDNIMMIVNGRRRELATVISDGDKVHFLTPVAGG